MIEVRGGSVSVVQGAAATFEATASRELASASVDGNAAKMDGNRLISAPQKVPEERMIAFDWEDTLGLTPKESLKLHVQPVEDEAPRLVARRERLSRWCSRVRWWRLICLQVMTLGCVAWDCSGVGSITMAVRRAMSPRR